MNAAAALDDISRVIRRGLSRMVGLHGANCEHRVGALHSRLAKKEFQLAQLVAAQAEACAVVPFDVKLRPAKVRRQARQRLDRRR